MDHKIGLKVFELYKRSSADRNQRHSNSSLILHDTNGSYSSLQITCLFCRPRLWCNGRFIVSKRTKRVCSWPFPSSCATGVFPAWIRYGLHGNARRDGKA